MTPAERARVRRAVAKEFSAAGGRLAMMRHPADRDALVFVGHLGGATLEVPVTGIEMVMNGLDAIPRIVRARLTQARRLLEAETHAESDGADAQRGERDGQPDR